MMFLEDLVPEAKFDYAHGKMTPSLIEKKMEAFIDGDTDVLVCTTILESGIDIPNVNTIIIENSDRLGLSQLYQMRGRVGRSSRQAFAYILFDKNKVLTENSEKRLQAMREFTDLGSGFKIAMRDLEIRGAGSLFGEMQHGHLEKVGYEMYNRLLNEVMAEINGEKLDDVDVTIDLNIDSYIPDEYVKEQKYKMDIYQDIVSTYDNEEMKNVINLITDRYGKMPEVLKNFIKLMMIRNISKQKGIIKILQLKSEDGISKLYIDLADDFNLSNMNIIIQKYGTRISFKKPKNQDALGTVIYTIKDNDNIIQEVYTFLKLLENKEEMVNVKH